MTPPEALPSIDPRTAARGLAEGSAVLVDIREPDETARERISGAECQPLSKLGSTPIPSAAGRTTVFFCRSGNRTRMNAARLRAACPGDAALLEGGLEAWRAAGLPMLVDRGQPIELMRQVQIAAGSLVLSGVLLALSVSVWFIALSAFVGAGLIFAEATGFCGMARLLAVMPWNRVHRLPG